ncbi:MAG: D-glycero-beta-D-manno-heptose-7-phosphate kinase [Parvibaculum sp.]|nr:D-glycero-beta-D-manno-heptose-7-phosphate kinase [Parvibaculum sp.]
MSYKQRLADDVEQLRDTRILCVGDVMLDRYVYGDVVRVSPEAPIPVLKVREERAMLGGAGNVARNLAAIGAKVSFVSVVGADAEGDEIAAMLETLGETDARLVRDATRRSTVKTRYVGMNQQMLRADQESDAALSLARQDDVIGHVRSFLPHVQVLVLSDYGKGVLTPEVCRVVIEEARDLNIPVIVDPKGRNYSPYGGATVITPNKRELGEATGYSVDSETSIVEGARSLIGQFSIHSVLVTRSQDGMSIVAQDGTVTHLLAEAREVFDVSGAGDTVVAVLASALAAGLPLVDAAGLANVAAGLVVGKVGTAVVYRDELTAKLRERKLSTLDNKVATQHIAQDIAENWRRKGLRVGFTNGCFDLLHPGHVTLLAQSRALCDRLVVGLNSDASVSRLKGPTRPIQPDVARATVLASLSNVDLVVMFEEDTPENLIGMIRPDVLIKGGDYTVETIVGASFVQSYGGHIEIIDLVPGFSTTKTVEKMNS